MIGGLKVVPPPPNPKPCIYQCVNVFLAQGPAGVKAAQGEPTGLFSKISHLR